MEDIERIWERYSEAFAAVQFRYRDAKSILDKQRESLSEVGVDADPLLATFEPSWSGNMSFRRLDDGERVFYHFYDYGREELIRQNARSRLRTYQWLFVDAYELFEAYLLELYAYIGHKDHFFWPCADFGSLSFSEVGKQPLQWFHEQAKKKKDLPKSLLNVFRQRLSEFARIEKENSLKGRSALLWSSLAPLMRHVIVHRQGRIESLENFKARLADMSGLGKSVINGLDASNLIGAFVSKDSSGHFIDFTELYDAAVPFVHHPRLEMACDLLLALMYLLKQQLSATFPDVDSGDARGSG